MKTVGSLNKVAMAFWRIYIWIEISRHDDPYRFLLHEQSLHLLPYGLVDHLFHGVLQR